VVKSGGVWLVGEVVGLLVVADDAPSDLERAEAIVDAGARLRTSGYSLMLLPNGVGVELSQKRRRWRRRFAKGERA
jgi:hypothetical protein